jgi:hypothetical protein
MSLRVEEIKSVWQRKESRAEHFGSVWLDWQQAIADCLYWGKVYVFHEHQFFEEEWVVALDARATRGENILADNGRAWGNFLQERAKQPCSSRKRVRSRTRRAHPFCLAFVTAT